MNDEMYAANKEFWTYIAALSTNSVSTWIESKIILEYKSLYNMLLNQRLPR